MQWLWRLVSFLARNPYAHLFLGGVVLASGIAEAYEAVADDLSSARLRGHHGIILIGIWQLSRAVGEIIESFDYLNEAKPRR